MALLCYQLIDLINVTILTQFIYRPMNYSDKITRNQDKTNIEISSFALWMELI